MRPLRLIVLALLSACALTPVDTPSASAARRAADNLLAADRAFAASAATTDLINGVTAMFAPDVIVPVPGVGFAEGLDAATGALRLDTLNATSRAAWEPVRVGISADGLQGFTIGYFDVTRADGTVALGKYLAYWVKGAEGWRVAVWRRGRRPDGAVDITTFEPSLPARLVPPTTDSALIAGHRASLAQAERDFSAEAQVIGLGPAFAKFGRADAMHLGGPTSVEFVVGNDSIAKSVQGDDPVGSSPVTWGPDRVIVASSGDLGVSIGLIAVKEPVAAGTAPRRIPFFTIWRRDSVDAPWRYIAE